MCVKTCQNRCALLWLLLFSPHSLQGWTELYCASADIEIPLTFVQWILFPCLLIHTPFSCSFSREVPFCPLFELGEESLSKWMLGSDKMGELRDFRRRGCLWRIVGCNNNEECYMMYMMASLSKAITGSGLYRSKWECVQSGLKLWKATRIYGNVCWKFNQSILLLKSLKP